MSKNQTILQVLEKSVALFGKNEAIYDGSRRLSYNELWQETQQFAKALISQGISKGDKVIVCLPNWHEFVVIYFALARIGAVLIPGNPDEQNKEWDRILLIPGVKAVCCSKIDETTETLIREKLLHNAGQIITVRFSKRGLLAYDELLKCEESIARAEETGQFAKDNLFAILYTSGSTGTPKGVMLTHANFIYSAANVVNQLKSNTSDVFLVPVPFSHVFGLIPGILSVIMAGGRIVTMAKFRADAALNLIEQEKVTVQFGVPTMFILELNDPTAGMRDFQSLRTGIMGGAPCPESIVKKIVAEMGCDIIVSYGSTETAGGVTYTSFDDTEHIRSRTVGRVSQGMEIKIVDENRAEVPAGTVGELACRGKGVSKGYYQMQETTQNVIDNAGWFYTGDLAKIDDNGYIHLVGRKKDIIIRGGLNIYPHEIEEIFYTHPGVADIAVVGLPDTVLGEVTCAAIKLSASHPNETETTMKDFIQDKVAKCKIPDHILFIDYFLLSQSGKINKKALRELCHNRLKSVLR
ncbi:class I adenylate-forming enzyme family protein [Anaerospora hongkongensis]|uniref:class I adenylate-forming enzyme family protein n=1 Tax=Anaerospora hongkongensis TaxID=244830 RepID=UPI002898AB8F|nr:class I adenylate-forming enzyme family protein [Anaerospora hongkongensis]